MLILGGGLSVGGQIKSTYNRLTLESSDPAYRIEIRANGAVTYVGEKYVKIEGVRKATLSHADRKKLKEEVLRAQIDKMRPRYAGTACLSGGSEEPTLTLKFTSGARTFSIDHYLACYQGRGRRESELRRLRRLESWIYRLTRADEWIGTERVRLFQINSPGVIRSKR